MENLKLQLRIIAFNNHSFLGVMIYEWIQKKKNRDKEKGSMNDRGILLDDKKVHNIDTLLVGPERIKRRKHSI